MSDYKKLESSHRLSKYEIRLHFWRGRVLTTVPFCAWKNNGALTWYQSYNMTKHNRHKQFKEANFENMIDAVCGLLALLSSQFINDSFSGGPAHLVVRGGAGGGFEVAIGDFFHVKFPDDWPEDERYDFNWSNLKGEEDPFQNYPYPV
ncbi:hypothetical protein [uncultured Rhodospira sp.]|uniref:hypothetical protein n=1 Tax=uncultured Rhodospira sp. TaxID=1936189 RepID=UPI00262E69C1|nr:hypothetical protein [uncultured Rhodospira sp.]